MEQSQTEEDCSNLGARVSDENVTNAKSLERSLWRDLLLTVISLCLFLLVFSSSVLSGFTLVDDGTINKEMMSAIKSGDGAWGEVREAWYRKNYQSGGRYTPIYNVYRTGLIHLFHLNSSWFHCVHLFLSWIPFGMLGFFLARFYRSGLFHFLPLLVFVLFSETGWKSILWNFFDLSTYDPLAYCFLGFTIVFSLDFLNRRRTCYWYIPVLTTSAFLAAHSKETTALTALSLGVLFTLLGIKKSLRLRSIILGACYLIPVAFFFYGLYSSGAMEASQKDQYVSNYSPSIGLIIKNFRFFLAYTFSSAGLTYIIVQLLMISTSVFMTFRFFKYKEVPGRNFWFFLIITYAHLSALLAVLPIKNLESLPRLFYPSLALFSIQAAIALFYLFMPLNCFFNKREAIMLPIRYFLAILILIATPLVPLRLYSFQAFYNGVLGTEFEMAEYAREYLTSNPEKKIGVLTINDQRIWRSALMLHLSNHNVHGAYSRTPHVLVADLEKKIDLEKIPQLGIVTSRDSQFSKRVSEKFGVWDSINIDPQGYTTYDNTSFNSLLKWLFRDGQNPLKTSSHQAGYKLLILHPRAS